MSSHDQPAEPKMCHRKRRLDNWRIEVEPWRGPYVGETEGQGYRRMADDLQAFLREHAEWRNVRVSHDCDEAVVCSHCGCEWEPASGADMGGAEDGYNPEKTYCAGCGAEVKEEPDGQP